MISAAEFSDRVDRATAQLKDCQLCEHRCGADRCAGQRGPCKASSVARVFRHRVEYGEELELIPSHLFYLSGCDLRCKFCIAESSAFQPRIGTPLTAEFLAQAIQEGRPQQPKNIQWVGGEPTIHLPAVLQAMRDQTSLPPIVWKSDFHGTPESFALLDGVVDTYVADFKFGSNQCASRIAGVECYLEIVTRNLLLAANQADLIIRHLLLPGHFDCCFRPIANWVAKFLPGTKFSIRDGYLPRWLAKHDPQLSRPLEPRVARQAFLLSQQLHLNLVS